MATYRCLSCAGIYVNPQGGMEFPHACPPIIDDVQAGTSHLRPDHRDESLVQEFELFEGAVIMPKGGGVVGTVHIRRHGRGRVKLSDLDLLTGADAARLAQLRAMAGTPVPD